MGVDWKEAKGNFLSDGNFQYVYPDGNFIGVIYVKMYPTVNLRCALYVLTMSLH